MPKITVVRGGTNSVKTTQVKKVDFGSLAEVFEKKEVIGITIVKDG